MKILAYNYAPPIVQEIKLTLTVEELVEVKQALGAMPFDPLSIGLYDKFVHAVDNLRAL